MKISLKAARINAGYKLAEAARLIGISVSTLKLWEAGKTFPRQPMIEKMCALYGVRYDQLNFFAQSLA